MKRLLATLLCWSAVAFSVASAIPARPRYEPPELPQLPVGIALANTTWQGKLYTEGERVTFHPDGTLTYHVGQFNNGGGSPGSWRLNGNQLYFEINKFSEYQTTVTGDVIQGNGTNKSGQTTKPFLRRVAYDGTAGVKR